MSCYARTSWSTRLRSCRRGAPSDSWHAKSCMLRRSTHSSRTVQCPPVDSPSKWSKALLANLVGLLRLTMANSFIKKPTTPFHSVSTTFQNSSFSSSSSAFHRTSSVLRWVRKMPPWITSASTSCDLHRSVAEVIPKQECRISCRTSSSVWYRFPLSGSHRPLRSCRQESRRFPSQSVSTVD